MICKGNPVSEGLGIGEVYCYRPLEGEFSASPIPREEVARHLAEYERIKEKADAELCAIINQLQRGQPDKAQIFMAQQEILHDEVINEKIRREIGEKLSNLTWAIYTVYEEFRQMLAKMEKEIFRERAQDIIDVRNRLLRVANGINAPNLNALEKPVVIAAHDLLPSDTATLDRSKVVAIVTATGGETSHSAILARSYGIPALLGIPGLMELVKDGDRVIVDALDGELIIDPSAEELKKYEEKRRAYLKWSNETAAYLGEKARTKDGEVLAIGLNIGSVAESRAKEAAYADFIGLFRTEFLYLSSPELPGEEEQYETYKQVLENFKRPVILRTLDIGGDKNGSCLSLPEEENPFLGVRGLRLCFDRPEVFKTQLRAAFRAAVHGDLSLMLPMVTTMDDIYQAKELMTKLRREMEEAGIPVAPKIKVGIMVEVPSIALLADLVAKEVDFVSFGTNDLCQYTLAVDRKNPRVANYYQSYHPALFRLIGDATKQFLAAGKPVSVCGELGGDPLAVPVLLGLGVRRFSMNPSSIAKVKRVVTRLTIDHAQELAVKVQRLATADQVKQLLEKELKSYIY